MLILLLLDLLAQDAQVLYDVGGAGEAGGRGNVVQRRVCCQLR